MQPLFNSGPFSEAFVIDTGVVNQKSKKSEICIVMKKFDSYCTVTIYSQLSGSGKHCTTEFFTEASQNICSVILFQLCGKIIKPEKVFVALEESVA